MWSWDPNLSSLEELLIREEHLVSNSMNQMASCNLQLRDISTMMLALMIFKIFMRHTLYSHRMSFNKYFTRTMRINHTDGRRS